MTRLFAGTPFDIPPTCDRCGASPEDCACPPETAEKQWKDPAKQSARVRVENRKHKRKATVVAGLSPDDSDLAALLTQLKNACGAGGTIKDGNIELQGDHGQRVRKELASTGYRVK